VTLEYFEWFEILCEQVSAFPLKKIKEPVRYSNIIHHHTRTKINTVRSQVLEVKFWQFFFLSTPKYAHKNGKLDVGDRHDKIDHY